MIFIIKIHFSARFYGLIHELQDKCVIFFDIVKNLIQMYYNNLTYYVMCGEKKYERWVEHVDLNPIVQFRKKKKKVGFFELSSACPLNTDFYYYSNTNKILKTEEILVEKENAYISDLYSDDKAGIINHKLKSLTDFVEAMQFKEHYEMLKINAGFKNVTGDNNYFGINIDYNLPNYYIHAVLNCQKNKDGIDINVINYEKVKKELDAQLSLNKTVFTEENGYPFGIKYASYKDIDNFILKQKSSTSLTLPEIENTILYCSPILSAGNMIDSNEYLIRNNGLEFMCDGDSYKTCLEPLKSPGTVSGRSENRKPYCVDYDSVSNISENFYTSTKKYEGTIVGNFFNITNVFKDLGISMENGFSEVVIELPLYEKAKIGSFSPDPKFYSFNRVVPLNYQEFGNIILNNSLYFTDNNMLYYKCVIVYNRKIFELNFKVKEKSIIYIDIVGNKKCPRMFLLGEEIIKNNAISISQRPLPLPLPLPRLQPAGELSREKQSEIRILNQNMTLKLRELKKLKEQFKSASTLRSRTGIELQINELDSEISKIDMKLRKIDPEYIGHIGLG